jgi:hypothetical protein
LSCGHLRLCVWLDPSSASSPSGLPRKNAKHKVLSGTHLPMIRTHPTCQWAPRSEQQVCQKKKLDISPELTDCGAPGRSEREHQECSEQVRRSLRCFGQSSPELARRSFYSQARSSLRNAGLFCLMPIKEGDALVLRFLETSPGWTNSMSLNQLSGQQA